MSRIQVGDYVQIIPVSGVFTSNIYQIKSLTSLTSPKSSVIVTLQHIDDPSKIETLIIGGTITIRGQNDPIRIRFERDLNKFEEVRTSRQIQPGQIQFAMTGVKPVDINILVQMEHKDIISACQVDKYVSELCKDPQLWELRVKKYYPGAEEFKDVDKSWKDYYNHLTISMDIPEDDTDDDTDDTDDDYSYDGTGWDSGDDSFYGDDDDYDGYDNNPINRAVKRGYLDVLKWLLKDTPDPDMLYGFIANRTAKYGHLKTFMI